MRKLKYLSRFTHLVLIAVFSFSALSFSLSAQEEMPIDEETIIPTNPNTPPVIIDESDSGSVSDVEEFDG